MNVLIYDHIKGKSNSQLEKMVLDFFDDVKKVELNTTMISKDLELVVTFFTPPDKLFFRIDKNGIYYSFSEDPISQEKGEKLLDAIDLKLKIDHFLNNE